MTRPTPCCMAGCNRPGVRETSWEPALVYCEGHYWDRLRLAGPAPTPPPPADPPAPVPTQRQLFEAPRPRPDAWPECKHRSGGKRR